jgi:sec-independent protein translocase protein TatC
MKRTKPGSEMPFLDHLEELRWRLIWMIGAVFVGFGVGFFLVVHFDLINVLAQPAVPFMPRGKLVYTHPMDVLTNVMTLSFAVGLILALPVVLYQLWAFVAPALW